ncbi:hypothetical protein ACIO3O_37345 [Streptomyces sp. NPDC087440]|uniref:hypothetical protein n=1 Tax=Streptomyces sp. NPDC087440 TaxID=3365790 RepID=UPI0038092F27
MSLTVTGTFDDGAAYVVRITGRADRPVIGSHRVAALVAHYVGRPVRISPTGPQRTLEPSDKDAVLAVLREHTHVVQEGPGASRRASLPRT